MAISRILVVIDPTSKEQPAFARSLQAAKEIGASLHIYSCVYAQYDEDEGIGDDTFHANIIDSQQVELEQLAVQARDEGVDVVVEVEWGENWYDAIVDAACRHSIDLLFKSSFKHTKAQRLLTNTSDWTLLRTCPCPVLLVKNNSSWRRRVVLAAVDMESKDIDHRRLSTAIIRVARDFSDNYRAKVHVFNSYNDSLQYPDRTRLLEQSGVPPQNIHIKSGDIEGDTVDLVAELDAELLVIGTVARTGISGAFVGNTVERILDRVDCDVLCIN